jgi:NAD+ kinase
MKIAIFGNILRPVIMTHLKILFSFAKEKNIILQLDEDLYDFAKAYSNDITKETEIITSDNFNANFVLSIGGDGTFLTTAARVGRKNIPILGVNTGRLGFLTDVAGENLISTLEAIIAGKHTIEERTLLKLEAKDGTPFSYPYALNDISILKQESSSMISINVSLNDEPINRYQADGLVISTPTGSTAYSMSVGGPIVVPQARNFIISPVASHSLNVRPLVVPDDWIIDLEVKSRSNNYMVSLDGRTKILEQNTKLRIVRADYTIKVIKQKHHTFFDTLKNKLMWGIDKRN